VTVTLFTVPACPRCQAVKEFLHRRRVPFVELNVEGDFANLRRMRRLTPTREVPVTAAAGRLVVGFDAPALEALLDHLTKGSAHD